MPRPGQTTHASAEALYDVIRHVRPLYRHLAKAVEDRLAGTGVTVAMRAVLERLHDGGPQTVPQIARSLMIPRQFAQRIVNELIEAGQVERVRNDMHKRSWLLYPTPAGQSTFAAIRSREETVLRNVAADLTAEDVETCRRVLAHLTKEFGAIARQGEAED